MKFASHGFAVVSWFNDDPYVKDITGWGPEMDIPFPTPDEARAFLHDEGYVPSDETTAIVVELLEIGPVG